MQTDTDRARTIRFWHAVEMFSPQRVERVGTKQRVSRVLEHDPLPWEPGHQCAREGAGDGNTWMHVVYLGVFQLDAVSQVLAEVFPTDQDAYEERPGGESAVAAFVVDEDGRASLSPFVLSSCAWAIGRVKTRGPDSPQWLSGFDNDATKAKEALEQLVTDRANDDGRQSEGDQRAYRVSLEKDDLYECRDLMVSMLEVEATLKPAEIRVKSMPVSKSRADPEDVQDFLNSFYFDDLAMIAHTTESGEMGTALREYLRSEDELGTSARLDVSKNPDAVFQVTAPGRVPAGRWPENSIYSLASSQQLAIDHAWPMLEAGTGLRGVNGPPGTGKTTMLRDLVAGLVVERARRLAALDHPADAFAGEPVQWKTGDWDRKVQRWNPELTGFEIVVASSNNGAVENVTNEIPARDAVDDEWRQAANDLAYFDDIGSALLAEDQAERKRDKNRESSQPSAPAWAAVAARLGNMKNRGNFKEVFWWRGWPTVREMTREQFCQLTEDELAEYGLFSILLWYMRTPLPVSWEQATTRFRRAFDRVEHLRLERQQISDALEQRPRIAEHLEDLRTRLARATERSEAAQEAVASADQTVAERQAEVDMRVARRAEHRQFRPGFWEWLTSLGKAMRTWRTRDEELASEVAAAEDATDRARGDRARIASDADQAARTVEQLRHQVEETEDELARLNRLLDRAQETLGDRFPEQSWWDDREQRERSPLWTDATWNEARSELFLEALRLHKVFLRLEAAKMRESLQGAIDIVAGEAPADLPAYKALEAWRALFFVVPVVSTTFASFARLFSHLDAENLGWVLIDEAGQASPQEAVGALWRSKRALVVGDPLQLTPVTTVPFPAEQAIRRQWEVDEQWSPSQLSVQQLADRVTSLGTWLSENDTTIWVGSPLVLHRRCDQPMFDIVNTIAYGGLMINGTAPTAKETFDQHYRSLPESKWIDVPSNNARGRSIPAEGDELKHILAKLATMGVDMSEVMVIGPFRDVASQVQRITTDLHPDIVSGTVHTSQGKQANIVIIVLGSDPNRPGTRRWASKAPNLLNVAVSRAKRRLYVIGNHHAWATHPYFDVLARRLPRDHTRRTDARTAGAVPDLLR